MRLALGAIAISLASANAVTTGTGQIAARVKFSHTELGTAGLLVYAKRVGVDASMGAVTDPAGVAMFRGLEPGLYQVLTPQSPWTPKAQERVAVRAGQLSNVVLPVATEPIFECSFSGDSYDDTPRRGRVPAYPPSRRRSAPGPRGSIYGIVTDPGGHPLPMARIHVVGTASSDAEDRRTELSGEFGIGDLRAGQYRLEVHAAGYEGRALTVTVAGGRQVTLNLALPTAQTVARGIDSDVVVELETGFGPLRIALDRASNPGVVADVQARLSRHELDDGNLKRTADGEVAMNAKPLYLTWQCGQRTAAAGRDLRAWLRVDGAARLTLETDAGAVAGRVIDGADVLARLLKQRLFEPVALMAVSMSHSSKTR